MAPRGKAAELIGVGTAAAALGGAYKFGEFLYKAKRLRDVGPANAVYVRVINRVRLDLDEVKRLLTVPDVKKALEANPPKAKWVYGAMRDVRGALENITPHTERVGSDVEDGRRVGIRHRLYWLLSEKEKLENREKELVVAHSTLNEVIGYLTALEPAEESEKGRGRHSHNTKIDVDVRHDRHDRLDERDVYERGHRDYVEERDVVIERDERDPRRVVEERDIYVREHDHGRGPHRHIEERDVFIEREHDHGRGPARYEEREYVDRDGRHEERFYEDRRYGPQSGRVNEAEFHVQRDPRDPRHVEAQFVERGPGHYNEKRYEERRFDSRGPRRPDSFEDREPERDSWMQNSSRRPPSYGPPPYDDYAEYGAPQPSGAANYGRKFTGDYGFGDELVLNPQPVPPLNRDFEREVSSYSKHRDW